jgi:hypothetical protein
MRTCQAYALGDGAGEFCDLLFLPGPAMMGKGGRGSEAKGENKSTQFHGGSP